MSSATSSAAASATTTYAAISTPNGPSGIPISRIGAIIGGVLGGVIFLLLVSLGIIFFFCSNGRKPGRSKNISTPKAPGWAKTVWNAEKSYGAGHDHSHGLGQTQDKPPKAESKKAKMMVTDLEKGTPEQENQKNKKGVRAVLPWGQHDPQEYIREQQEHQRQRELEQQQQLAQATQNASQQYGYPVTSDQRTQYGYPTSHAQYPPQQQFAQNQAYHSPPQVRVQIPQAAYQQQGSYGGAYYPPRGQEKGAYVSVQQR